MPLYGGRRSELATDQVDSALESLQFSYLDGVPFVLDPRLSSALSTIEGHLAKAKTLMDQRSVNQVPELPDLSHIGRLETQVLEQLERLDLEREKRRKKAEDEIADYKREKAEKEAQKAAQEAEEEAKKAAEEAKKAAEEESKSSSTEDVSAASTQPARSPPPPPTALTGPLAAPPNLPRPANPINFSEFERECDPFERAELATLNDMQELAAVLQTTSFVPAAVQAPAVTALSTNATATHTTGSPFAYGATYQVPPVYSADLSSSLKSSKSVGDLMTEIQKEAQPPQDVPRPAHGPQETQKQRQSSRTPPPPKTDWIPWPDLEGGSQPKELANLSDESVKKCQRLADMGFPLARVAKICRALGDDEQQMINFCLLVDKLHEEKHGDPGDIEDVLLLHSVDESRARKHLESFVRLADFGFAKRKIHDALTAANLDYNKAVEKLLAENH